SRRRRALCGRRLLGPRLRLEPCGRRRARAARAGPRPARAALARPAPRAAGAVRVIRLPRFEILVSFDIDGTLELGDPPGIITVEMVRSLKRRGYVIGSGSDRPLSYQRELWKRLQIDADFTVLKHRLAEIKSRFLAQAYYHVGDTDV